MKNCIYCETTAKGQQTFYLKAQGMRYYLFAQRYRVSNKEVFGRGIALSDLKKHKKHHSYSVRQTIAKLPAYIRYVEKEYEIAVMEKTKRKQEKPKNRKRFSEKFSLYYDVV